MVDTTRLRSQTQQTFVDCQVLSVPPAGGTYPKQVTVRLLNSDGPANYALWNGYPNINPGDQVKARRDSTDNDILIIGEAGSPILPVQWETGVIDGGELTAATGNQFNISAGTGYIVDNVSNPFTPAVQFVEWGALGPINPLDFANQTQTLVWLDSSGAVSLTSDPTEFSRFRTHIFLGFIGHNQQENTIYVEASPKLAYLTHDHLYDLFFFVGYTFTGFEIFCVSGTLNIRHTGGEVFYPNINWYTNKLDPNTQFYAAVNPITFTTYMSDRQQAAGQTNIPVGFYDDLSGGAPEPIPGAQSRAANYFVYLTATGGILVQYGQTVYDTLQDALEGLNEERGTMTRPVIIERYGALLGVVCATAGATDLCDTDQAIVIRSNDLSFISGGGGTAPPAGSSIWPNAGEIKLKGTVYNTIQAAINACTGGTGEIIYLGEGTYTESNIQLNKSQVTIKGVSKNLVTITDSANLDILLIPSTGSEFTLEDLTISNTHNNASETSCLSIDGAGVSGYHFNGNGMKNVHFRNTNSSGLGTAIKQNDSGTTPLATYCMSCTMDFAVTGYGINLLSGGAGSNTIRFMGGRLAGQTAEVTGPGSTAIALLDGPEVQDLVIGGNPDIRGYVIDNVGGSQSRHLRLVGSETRSVNLTYKNQLLPTPPTGTWSHYYRGTGAFAGLYFIDGTTGRDYGPIAGQLTNFTPGWAQGVGLTYTLDHAWYKVLDDMVHLFCRVIFTSSGSNGANLVLSNIPLGMVRFGAPSSLVGYSTMRINGVWYTPNVAAVTNTSVQFLVDRAGYMGSNPSLAVGSGSEVGLTLQYRWKYT